MAAEIPEPHFLVTSVDPGLTAGAVVVVDLLSGELVFCSPYSLSEMVPRAKKRKTSLTLKNGTTTAAPRKAASNRELTINDIAAATTQLMWSEMRDQFFGTRYILVETQMKPKLRCAQVAMQSLGGLERCLLSSPRAVRNYYGLSVMAEACDSKRDCYELRKQLSVEHAAIHVSKPVLKMAMEAARLYWSGERSLAYKNGELRLKIQKAYGDIVEAYIQAMFPGNWLKFISSSSMAALPSVVVDGRQHYQEWQKSQRKKQRERAATASSRVLGLPASSLVKRRRQARAAAVSARRGGRRGRRPVSRRGRQ